MANIAVIPARGGSKRIPRKNIRLFHGKPMIVWSIEAALRAGVFDAVVVSTDDDEIAIIASSAGAEVPFRRPSELSGDDAMTMPVLNHAIDWWGKNKYPIEFVCCLYATAPFVRHDCLSQAIQILRKSDAEFLLSVARFDYPVQRSLKLDGHGMLKFAEPENALKRSQDLEPHYHDAGQFFVGRADAFYRHKSVLFGYCLPLILPREEVIDIDTEDDWRQAEIMCSAKNA
jgi:N-acylneuraminate cytidylyltransferase